MGNYWVQLRTCQLVFPELEVKSLKRKKIFNEDGSPKGINKPKKV